MEDYVYTQFVAPTTRSLYAEVMILGLFVVVIGYARTARTVATAIHDQNFWKRVALLGAVMLFTIYIVLTDQIDSAPRERPSQLLKNESLFWVQLSVLVIAPLELIMVTLGASLFLVLAVDPLMTRNTDSPPTLELNDRLFYLLVITGTWHACCVIWWLFNINDHGSDLGITYHASFALLHYLSAIAWNYWRRRNRNTNLAVHEWIVVCLYCSLILAVYITRVSWYVKYAVDRLPLN